VPVPEITPVLGWNTGRGVPDTGLSSMNLYRVQKQCPKGGEGIMITDLPAIYSSGNIWADDLELGFGCVHLRRHQQDDLPDSFEYGQAGMLREEPEEGFFSPYVTLGSFNRAFGALNQIATGFAAFISSTANQPQTKLSVGGTS